MTKEPEVLVCGICSTEISGEKTCSNCGASALTYSKKIKMSELAQLSDSKGKILQSGVSTTPEMARSLIPESISTKSLIIVALAIALAWSIFGGSLTKKEKGIVGYTTEIVFIRDNGYSHIDSFTKTGYEIVSSRRAWQGDSAYREWGTEYTLQKPIYGEIEK